MRRIVTGVLLALLGACSLMPAHAETDVRLAAWNIANLHHEEGVEVRPRIGTKRTESDFAMLARYARVLSADVIALQEVASPEAVHRVFPATRYRLWMSSRYEEDLADGIDDGIYTAIAVRRNAQIDVRRQMDIRDLQIDYDDESGDASTTRRGTAVELEVGDQTLWIASVHLKSSCATTRRANRSSKLDCQIFWRQSRPLRDWIEQRHSAGEAFVIAGDFNRRFRAFDYDGPFIEALRGQGSERTDLTVEPATVTRQCPTRKGRSKEPIDWFLFGPRAAAWRVPNSFWERRFDSDDVVRSGGRSSQRLSDHCPIHIDMTVPVAG